MATDAARELAAFQRVKRFDRADGVYVTRGAGTANERYVAVDFRIPARAGTPAATRSWDDPNGDVLKFALTYNEALSRLRATAFAATGEVPVPTLGRGERAASAFPAIAILYDGSLSIGQKTLRLEAIHREADQLAAEQAATARRVVRAQAAAKSKREARKARAKKGRKSPAHLKTVPASPVPSATIAKFKPRS
jgi:hypothetical protein